MDFTEFNLGFCNKGEIAEVTLSSAANVILLDTTNIHKYKNSMKFEYHGGHANVSPYRITIPESGTWYVVIDGYSGTIKCSVSVVE